MDSEIRKYVLNKYIEIIEDEDISVKLEENTFNESLKYTDIKDIDSYMLTYIKVLTFLNNNEKELDEEFIYNIPFKNREELNDKWSQLNDKKNNKKIVIKKKGLHKCPKCKSWFTDYQQMQTSSADESMRVSVVCLDCNWHWKYS